MVAESSSLCFFGGGASGFPCPRWVLRVLEAGRGEVGI